jgi:microcystin-dependent protein
MHKLGLAAATALAVGGGLALVPTPAGACGSDAYIGTVCLVASSYCPDRYAEARGQTLNISDYQALYSLIGTTYGGDGRVNFALPDLRGRVPIGVGQAPGQPSYAPGQQGGAAAVSLSVQMMPAHSHGVEVPIAATAALHGTADGPNNPSPQGGMLAGGGRDAAYNDDPSATVPMHEGSVTVSGNAAGDTRTAGGGAAVENRPPYLAMRYCIALEGVYPPRP